MARSVSPANRQQYQPKLEIQASPIEAKKAPAKRASVDLNLSDDASLPPAKKAATEEDGARALEADKDDNDIYPLPVKKPAAHSPKTKTTAAKEQVVLLDNSDDETLPTPKKKAAPAKAKPARGARTTRAPAKSYKLELPSDVKDNSFMVDDGDEEDEANPPLPRKKRRTKPRRECLSWPADLEGTRAWRAAAKPKLR
ncbi:hypothetical protein JCM8208_003561 [Rhodotorula glutinis]